MWKLLMDQNILNNSIYIDFYPHFYHLPAYERAGVVWALIVDGRRSSWPGRHYRWCEYLQLLHVKGIPCFLKIGNLSNNLCSYFSSNFTFKPDKYHTLMTEWWLAISGEWMKGNKDNGKIYSIIIYPRTGMRICTIFYHVHLMELNNFW